MTQQQKLITIFTIIGAVIIGAIVWWGISTINADSKTIKDKDTGEVYNPDVNNDATGAPSDNAGAVKLFGIENLVSISLKQSPETGYIDTVKEALQKYSGDRLDNKFASITVRPQGLSVKNSEVTGTIRIGQTDDVIPIKITLSSDNKTGVITINEGGSIYDGQYVYVGGVKNPDELLFSISQKSVTSSDLEIKTYEGYRDIALEYIESLGYNVPDFVITFTNYENPFK